eukprot:6563341-Pyramimonas_sp.AAC.2
MAPSSALPEHPQLRKKALANGLEILTLSNTTPPDRLQFSSLFKQIMTALFVSPQTLMRNPKFVSSRASCVERL